MKVKCIQSIAIKELEQTFLEDEEYNIPAKIANEHTDFFKKLSSTKDVEEVEEVEETE
jgi:hypothetical protein